MGSELGKMGISLWKTKCRNRTEQIIKERNDIITKRDQFENQDLKWEARKFLKLKLDIKVEVAEIYKLCNGIALSKCKRGWKKEILWQKKYVKGHTNTLWGWSHIKRKPKSCKEERSNGKQVKLGYQMKMNDLKMCSWKEIE